MAQLGEYPRARELLRRVGDAEDEELVVLPTIFTSPALCSERV